MQRLSTSLSIALLCWVWLSLTPSRARGQSNAPSIAIVSDGPSDRFTESAAMLARELHALFESSDLPVRFPSEPTHTGDFTEATAARLVSQALADESVDIVVGLGLHAGRAVAHSALPKPVVLPFANLALQNLPSAAGTSGQSRLFYMTGLLDLKRELLRFRDVIGEDRSVFLLDEYLVRAVPDVDTLLADAAGEAMELQLVAAGTTAASILQSIPAQARAVYIGPSLRLANSEIEPLLLGLIERGLPTYASQGRTWVERGAFTSLVPDDDLQRRMRRAALAVVDAWSGESLAQLPTAFEARTELAINMRTARRIGVYPRFELLTEAVLVDDDQHEPRGAPLTLRAAVGEALRENLDLTATRLDSDLASLGVREARAAFKPTADAEMDFTWLDPDAANSLGSPERTLTTGPSVTQLVYSARSVASLRSQKAARRATKGDIQAVALDLVRDVGVAFMNVLRAQTSERVNRENLRLTRANLALAEVRVEVGSTGRQDVFRWQAQIADDRARVINASASLNQAQIELNRLLNRPLEAPLNVLPPSNRSLGGVFERRLAQYVDNPWSFKMFRSFLVKEALRNSPELRALRATIASQSATLNGEKNSLFLPDLFLSGGFTHTLHRGGAGSGPPPSDIPGLNLARDDLTWQVGAAARFNLYDDARYARLGRIRTGVAQLAVRKKALRQAIEQRVRSALHRASASSAAVALAQVAASASAANLQLVRDAYRVGSVNVITLVDAQNQARLTELNAANSKYDFLIDLTNAQRASGFFSFAAPASVVDTFFERLDAFASKPPTSGSKLR